MRDRDVLISNLASLKHSMPMWIRGYKKRLIFYNLFKNLSISFLNFFWGIVYDVYKYETGFLGFFRIHTSTILSIFTCYQRYKKEYLRFLEYKVPTTFRYLIFWKSWSKLRSKTSNEIMYPYPLEYLIAWTFVFRIDYVSKMYLLQYLIFHPC